MSSELTRRSFAESVALAALAPVLGIPGSLSNGRWSETLALPVSEADEPGALAKALAGVIRAQYGKRLSRADLVTITGQIESGIERAAAIRKIELANGDEPDFVFSAMPAPGASPR
ncbi:MAG: hypothetical protein ABI766_07025 [Gemmatimonadales bacterium]